MDRVSLSPLDVMGARTLSVEVARRARVEKCIMRCRRRRQHQGDRSTGVAALLCSAKVVNLPLETAIRSPSAGGAAYTTAKMPTMMKCSDASSSI